MILLDILVIIGTIILAFVQIAFVVWLVLFILGGLLGLIMDPYYGLPEDKHRKKLVAKRKKKEKQNEM